MRKTRVKQLRKEFASEIEYLSPEDRLRSSATYKKLWRLFKKFSRERKYGNT
jgi:hypothetical protein